MRSHWLLRRLGARLHHPRLWHLNRRSVSGATAVGLFVAFLPIPLQMIPATLGAVWLRVNLPLAVACIFVTNPFTMGPAFYLCYKLGAWLLKAPPLSTEKGFTPSPEWLINQLHMIWQPLVAGSLIISFTASILGYCLVQIAWRSWIIYKRGSLLRHYGSH